MEGQERDTHSLNNEDNDDAEDDDDDDDFEVPLPLTRLLPPSLYPISAWFFTTVMVNINGSETREWEPNPAPAGRPLFSELSLSALRLDLSESMTTMEWVDSVGGWVG